MVRLLDHRFWQCGYNDSWSASVPATRGCATTVWRSRANASISLSTGVLIRRARPSRENRLAGGTEARSILDEASDDALLIGHELVAKSEHVVGAGLLVGLGPSVGLLRGCAGLRRQEQCGCGEAQQDSRARGGRGRKIPVMFRHGRLRLPVRGGCRTHRGNQMRISR